MLCTKPDENQSSLFFIHSATDAQVVRVYQTHVDIQCRVVPSEVSQWYDRGMRFTLLFVLSGLFLVLPVVASAQIVPCNGSDCDWGSLIQLAQNILNFIVKISIIITAVMFAYAGFLYFSDGGSSKNVSQAHGIFAHVVIGLVIVLVAWLVVNTILDVLTGKGLDQRSGDLGQTTSSLTRQV